eukprot:PhF_6_TR19758/c0_g1_i1/m.28820/K16750/BLOC1S2; biogenesis of lysosome-related organelles complex 1 subunit 2
MADSQQLKDATQAFAESLSKVVDGEVRVMDEDLKLLESSNLVLGRRYEGLAKRATTLRTDVQQMQQSYNTVASYFSQIDELESNITLLESLVKGLDDYSKRLERKMLGPGGK